MGVCIDTVCVACDDDDACAGDLLCNSETRQCVQCLDDADCDGLDSALPTGSDRDWTPGGDTDVGLAPKGCDCDSGGGGGAGSVAALLALLAYSASTRRSGSSSP